MDHQWYMDHWWYEERLQVVCKKFLFHRKPKAAINWKEKNNKTYANWYV
jgi:hypothetical protein